VGCCGLEHWKWMVGEYRVPHNQSLFLTTDV
jgi:hypothetical protein